MFTRIRAWWRRRWGSPDDPGRATDDRPDRSTGTAATPTAIRDVLDVYDEHLVVRGSADAPERPLRFYDRDAVPASGVVDSAEIAADAARFLDIEAATAERVLDVEYDYLDAKGLLG